MNGEVQKFEIVIRHQIGDGPVKEFNVARAESDPGDTVEEIYARLGKALRGVASHLDQEWDGS